MSWMLAARYLLFGLVTLAVAGSALADAPGRGKVYIVLWFDTEDYILPQSDDAAKRVAELLTRLGVRATFKVVGEKARTLERRGRVDVIAALKRHEIGYHSDLHSQHPTPAEYEAPLDWATGVAEFTRRERRGFEDVKRIFGTTPSCYGQPGSSWAPQAHAALKQWGVNVYLDEAGHVGLEGKPFYYGGLLNIFNTREGGHLRANHDWSNLEDAKVRFQEYRKTMTAAGGGLISIFFHPCEFVHGEFWDGVNFAKGANPAPAEWKRPPMVSAAEQARRFKYLEDLTTYLKSFPEVRFVTASEALKLYADRAQGHVFDEAAVREIARTVKEDISFQRIGDLALSPAEIFAILNAHLAARIAGTPRPIKLSNQYYGPSSAAPAPVRDADPFGVTESQFARTVLDVQSWLDTHHQIPNEVWLGSHAVTPERYLAALALAVSKGGAEKGTGTASTVVVPNATLGTTKYVSDDRPGLWSWVIFPEGFHAPNLMALAKLQAWTLKPAIPHEQP